MLGILMGIGPPESFRAILIGPTSFFDWFYNFLVMRTSFEWLKWVGPHEKMVLWLRNFGHGLSSSYILHDICVWIPDLTKFDQKSEKIWLEKWVGPHEKMVLWLWNFGHGLFSSYYMIFVLRSEIRPNLTKKWKTWSEKWVAFPDHYTWYICCDEKFIWNSAFLIFFPSSSCKM